MRQSHTSQHGHGGHHCYHGMVRGVASGWLLHIAGQCHSRRSKKAQGKQAAAAPCAPSLPTSPRACGLAPARASGARNIKTGASADRGIYLPTPSPPRSPTGRRRTLKQPGATSLYGEWEASRRSPLPRPPQQAGPGRSTYASVTRSAARGSRPGAVRVVAATGRTKATFPPV